MQWGSSNEQMNIWDIFRKDTPEHKQEKVSKAKQILRVVKVVVYLVLFFLVFLGSIVTKASLQILTNEFNKEKKAEFSINFAKDAIAYYILFILAIPDAVQMLISIFKFVFGTRTLPTIEEIVIMVVKECLHMLCLAIIVYKVMPILNSVEVCAFLAGMPLVPSILHTISYQEDEVSYRPMLNVLSILLQAAAVCAVPLYKFFEDQITTEETFWMIFATFIASIRWFEKYFKYSSGGTIVLKILSDYSNRIETQCASTLATSCCRLVLILILFPIYFAQNIHRPDTAFEWKPERLIECLEAQLNITCCTHYADTSMMTPFLVHFCASMGLYYAAVLATRICMDQICFFAALSLGTPVYVVIILISRVNDNWISNTFIKDVENMDLYVMAVVFVIAWLFQLRSCRRIWDSSHDRVVYKNKLFFLPHYCSPIADLSLLHSRRIAPEITGTGSSDTNKQTMTEVYICATMWHENRTEMKQIIKSLFRMDKDQAARQNDNKKVYKDKYKFEAHILFDDAMKTSEENADGKRKREPNEFVKQLMDIITRNDSTVKKTNYITPYGGTLNYTMPGNNKLVVHLKDKDKIRHKKRWSQIMYMYYLLGYKLMKEEKDPLKKEHDSKNMKNASSIRDVLSPAIIQKAENTYIMALDGDVDFSPEALQLLIDRMKTNPKVGAACGRIKPGGSGPVVWYQKFEYAIGHWLQKSAEHVFGCVLCSPGCFSLFRAIALMDDNIMNKYASLPTEPKHYLQYDQGEDRWLCTLMLQQGYRIEYCSAAEAVTFAPEEFREFFNQRRRWVPSTMANILDLLISYKRTTTKNSNISRLYILYQGLLFISSILGPSLVLLVMQSAISLVFKENVSPLVSYLLVYGPTLFFIIICLKCKTQTQLTAAMVLSAIYALFMVAVLVGTAVNIAEEGSFTPTAVFMYVLTGIFLAAGLFHPHELTDLLWGSLYFLCIPAGYLFLIVYAICNLNNVSWGTRETQTAIVEQQFDGKQQRKNILLNEFRDVSEDILGDIIKQIKATNVKEAWYTDLIPAYFQCHNNNALLRSIESVQNIVKNTESTVHDDFKLQKQKDKSSGSRSSKLDEISWAGDERKTLQDDEILFWNGFIKKYLKPIDSDKQKEKEIAQSLKEYRDKVAFAFFFVNAMWVVVMSAMNEVKGQLNIQIPAIGSNTVIEPLGLLFLLIFTILLFLQFIGMVRHRYGTFLHVLSATTLNQNQEKSVSYSEDAEDVHVHEHDASDTSPKDKTRRDGCYSLKNIVIIIAKEIFLYLAHHNE